MTFDVEKTIKYWSESSAYDLVTAKSLLEVKRFPHALFFGHLAIEKILKALVVRATKEHAPYTHSLTVLMKKTGIDVPVALIDHLAEYTEFNIDARYPDDKGEFYKKCTEDFTQKKFKELEEIYIWLTKKLQK
ncbi:MAG: HEPN domain-containing protein [Deltaproteobacteria bacterium]|nr:HEPN domain-containing protein [Deltaproteobacteria bacterium]